MRKNREFPYLIFALLAVWCPLFMGAWNKAKPSSATSLRNSNPEILANWDALETAFTQGHEFSTGGTNTGEHKQIKFNAPISTPTNAANKLFIYGKDVSSVIEAHILDESGNELQITSAGDLYSSAGLTVTTASTFNGSITLGAGDDLIGSATSDITFNTNKFTVAGATGNTVVAGTLDVTGNIDPTSYETTNGGFLDEDDMASDSATKVISQQSAKKYVDDKQRDYILIKDIKSNTTAGGTFTSGAWRTRTLNQETFDTGNNATLASNQITLVAGTYESNISCPALAVTSHVARLYNITDSSVAVLGTSEYTHSVYNGCTRSFIIGRFTISATKTFEVQHRCTSTKSSNGFGVAASVGSSETYTMAEFWKIN